MTSDTNKKIMAKNIQYYLDKKGITRSDMCSALNFRYSTVTEWLNANKYPRIDKIEKMAQYFGINKSELIEPRDNRALQRVDTLQQDTAPINDLLAELFADRPDVCALLKNGVYADKNGTLVKKNLSDLPPAAKENLRNNILFVLESTGYLQK